MKLEAEQEIENAKLIKASTDGDNQAIMELSKNVSKIDNEIEKLFERLEFASETLDAVLQKYDEKLKELE